MVGGMVLSARDLSQLATRFHLLDLGHAARVAARQVVRGNPTEAASS